MTVTYRPQTGSSAMAIEPLQSALGAYVTGIDLRNLNDAAFAALRQAWLDHLVIVIRGQQLTDDDLTAFSARLGVLDEVPPVGTGQKPRDNRHVSVISNLVENGVPIGGLGDDEVIWHSDTSYRDYPPSASVLHALEIPAAGGDTSFANMYFALETLPQALRERIDALTVKNDATYNAGGQLREGFAPVADVRACPGATHPLVRTHPETRCDALYLGRRRNAYVPGLALKESEALLDVLWSHATQENLVWHHTWRTGDVAIWDNRCAMHHRDPFDADARRVMHRAQARDGQRPARDRSAGRAAHSRGQHFLSTRAASPAGKAFSPRPVSGAPESLSAPAFAGIGNAKPIAISIRPLTPVFGAEITGVDLAHLDEATFGQIEDAFETYSVLVFPRQSLDKDSQIAFSSRFGELETTQGHIANNFTVSHVSVISNLDPDGKLMGADDPRVQYRLGQRNWHSDSSFKRVPAKASLLYARVLPPDGGETQFASLRAAYDALPAESKRKLEGQVAIHHYAYSRRGMNIKLTNEEEDRRFPPVPQAIIRSNPKNGRKALYVGSHASHILDMPQEEGRAWLGELLEFATREDFTYLHRWQVGDLVMYDNRAALHRGRPYAITAHPRVLHRTTVAGEGPTA